MGTLGIATLDTAVDLSGLRKGLAQTKKETETEFQKVAGAITKVLKGLQAGMAAAAGAGATFKKAFDFSREGAAFIQTGESFDLLIKKIGAAPDLLEQLTKASGGTITQMKLMSGTATLLAGAQGDLGLALANSTPRLLEIARAAQKLNPSLGDTSYLYESLARGIKRASPLILDNLGLTIKVGEANEKYAAKIGKAVEALTAEEQKMALLEETLRAGGVLIDQVGGNTDSLTDSWDRFSVKIEEGTDSVKKWLAEGLMPWLDLMKGGRNNIGDALVEHVENMTDMAQSYEEYAREVDRAIAVAVEEDRGRRKQYEAVTRLTEAEWNAVAVHGEEAKALSRSTDDRLRAVDWTEALYIAEMEYARSIEEVTAARWDEYDAQKLNAVELAKYTRITEDDRLKKIDWKLVMEDVNAELEEMEEAQRAVNEELHKAAALTGDYFTEALGASDASRELTDKIKELRDKLEKLNENQGTYVKVLGSTEIEMLEAEVAAGKLATAQKKLADNTDPDKHAELALAVAKAKEKMDKLSGALKEGNEYWVDNTAAIADTQAELETLEAERVAWEFYDMADAAGADAVELAILAGAMGLYDEAQLNAALNAAFLKEKIRELAEKYAAGEISIYDARQELLFFKIAMDNVPTSKDVTVTTHFKTKGMPAYQLPGGGEEYQHGAWKITQNQLALLHAGEMVIPARLAEAIRNRAEGAQTTNNLTMNINSMAPVDTTVQNAQLAFALVGA